MILFSFPLVSIFCETYERISVVLIARRFGSLMALWRIEDGLLLETIFVIFEMKFLNTFGGQTERPIGE